MGAFLILTWGLLGYMWEIGTSSEIAISVLAMFVQQGGQPTWEAGYVTANLRNQIFPGIPNPLRESGESLKLISIKSNLTELNLE